MANTRLDQIQKMVKSGWSALETWYGKYRPWIISGLTVVSIVLIVWARFGFTFEVGQFFAAESTEGVLTVECSASGNTLTWTRDSSADSNSLQRGNSGAKGTGVSGCADYWCWLPSRNFNHQIPTQNTPATYTDTNLQEGVCYEYRAKYQPQVPSNSVFCPTNCNIVNTPPRGFLGNVTDCAGLANADVGDREAFGWAVDDDDQSVPITVHVYIDGAPGSCDAATGCTFEVVTADDASADLNNLTPPIPGNHRWSLPIPDQYRDGQDHTIRAYGIDLTDNTNNRELNQSPQTFNVPATCETPTHLICENNACVSVDGAGNNECAADDECVVVSPVHLICENNACVTVGGFGDAECSIDADCAGTIACTQDVTQCPDGSFVGRVAPLCQFASCPDFTGELILRGEIRNFTEGGSYAPSASSRPSQQLQVRMLIDVSGQAQNVILSAVLPDSVTYVTGTTTIDNQPTSVDAIAGAGLAVGSLGGSMQVTFRVATKPAGSLQSGTITSQIALQARADNLQTVNDSVTFIIDNGTVVVQVSQVQTGPGDVTLLALMSAALLTLLYVSYTYTHMYRSREVDTITKRRNPLNFK